MTLISMTLRACITIIFLSHDMDIGCQKTKIIEYWLRNEYITYTLHNLAYSFKNTYIAQNLMPCPVCIFSVRNIENPDIFIRVPRENNFRLISLNLNKI